jgi:hypothetical protein
VASGSYSQPILYPVTHPLNLLGCFSCFTSLYPSLQRSQFH